MDGRSPEGSRERGTAMKGWLSYLHPLKPYWPLAVLMLVALWLRRYHLGYQSLWFDEADAVMRAHASVVDLAKLLFKPGENGPLYLLLLHLWMDLFGDAESRVRMLSVVFGVLSVPTAFLLAQRFLDRGTGWLAALLVAVSPFQIWQSQEAKMYAMATFLVGLSTLVILHWKTLGGAIWSYPVLAVTATFSHLFSMLLLPYHALALWLQQPRRGTLIPAVFACLALLPLAAALMAAALVGLGPVRLYRPMGLLEMLEVMAKTFSVNRADPFTETTGALFTAVLALLGIATLLVARRVEGILLAGLLAVPLIPFLALNRTLGLFEERYLFVSYLGYVVSVAVGLRWLWSRHWLVGLASLACIVGLSISALVQVNFSEGPNRENWREAVRYLAAHFRASDAVAVQPGYLITAVQYYARQYPTLAGVPIITVPSLDRPDVTERDMEAALTRGTIGKERVWLFYDENRSSLEDPRARVWEWFHYNWYLADAQLYIGFRLYNYSFNGPFKAAEPWPQVPLRISYDDGLALTGLDLWTSDRKPQVDRGGTLPVTLRWLLTKVPPTSPVIRLELASPEGTTVSSQQSGFLNGFLEMQRLKAPQILWDYRDLELPQHLSPGRYELYVTVIGSDGLLQKARLSGDREETRVFLQSVWVR